MIYRQHHTPKDGRPGDIWKCPDGSFKRVLSRGGSWENVHIEELHPDERPGEDENVKQQKPGSEAGGPSAEISGGTGESAPGDGDDGEGTGTASGEGTASTTVEGEGT